MNTITHWLGCLLLCSLSFQALAQNTQVISIHIEGEEAGALFDTTFQFSTEVDVEALVDEIKARPSLQDQSDLSTMVVIRDINRPADQAEQRPQRSGPRPMLGVYLNTDGHGKKGVAISKIISGGGAEAAGMQRGDIITSIAGQETRSSHDISQAKSSYSIGDEVEVGYLRDGTESLAMVTLTAPIKKSQEMEVREEQTSHERGFMGVYTEELHEEKARSLGLDSQQGVYLAGIVSGSGAERGGLQKGDVITAINGRNLDAAYELDDALEVHSPGDTIQVGYWRDGNGQTTSVTLTKRIHQSKPRATRKRVQVERAFLGVYLEDEEGDTDGVRITGLNDGEAAEEAGLKRGDLILSIAGQETPNYRTLSDVMDGLDPGQEVRIRYLRKGERERVRLALGSRMVHEWMDIPKEAELEAEELLKEIDDRDQAEQLRGFMEDPSLDMERFDIFPNPNTGRFTLRFRMANQEDTDVRIFTNTGEEIYRERLRNFSGDYERRIDLREAVSPGVYFLQITRNGEGMVERLLISK